MSWPFTTEHLRSAWPLLSGDFPDLEFTGVSVDTRTLREGELFFALEGKQYDGHQFVQQAFAKGARAVVIRRGKRCSGEGSLLSLPDPRAFLARLAAVRRLSYSGHVIAITGSNGKTSTKEMLRALLSTRYRVHATEGNLNSKMGVPLTLLRLPEQAEVAIIEMGTNKPGSIAELCQWARPHSVLLTSIGEEHLEQLKTLDGVLKEETSIFPLLEPGGWAVIPDEPASLGESARHALSREQVHVEPVYARSDDVEILEDGGTAWKWRGVRFRLRIPGVHQARNAMLAGAAAKLMGVSESESAKVLESFIGVSLRGEWSEINGVRVLAECYNANPASTRAALDLLAALPSTGRKIAVLGTMLELGDAAHEQHQHIMQYAASFLGRGIDLVVLCGEFAVSPAEAAPERSAVLYAPTMEEAYQEVRHIFRPGDVVLLKGSRGMEMERWTQWMLDDSGSSESEG